MQLFNVKTISRHITRAAAPDPVKLDIMRRWGDTIRDRSINTQKETSLHGYFKQRILCDVLGYQDFNSSGQWTVDVETQIGAGSVDLALGRFTNDERTILAPFELKGAKTKNLDAIMPGRAKTPVQQAWEYASDNVGTKWVLVSNYLEIRLYSYSDGRQFYDSFDLAKLHDPIEYQRFLLLLSAENLLFGQTLAILQESRKEDRDITARLYADYRTLRSDLIGAVRTALPEGDPLESIRLGQTILDRVLFIAFAEDNGLLPNNSLLNAFQHRDPYHPKPIWQTFLGLFNAIDQGNAELKIPRYNGGLFHLNDTIAALALPDPICEGFKRLAEYDFASEISVTVLGHIFEQSISDVEQLQAEALGEAPAEKKASGTTGRRKRDGVVYTPDYIARFIVDQTLGIHCREIFSTILARYAAKGAKADDETIAWKSTKAERQAWAEYRDRLTALRIIDPACGSGVFLIMAFDFLKAELQRVNTKVADLSGTGLAGDLLDPDSEILTHNLYGVDVNSESVEIAKLSLWIKTARRGKVLDTLDANIRVGDSLIEDSNFAYRSHGFEWKKAFPNIFLNGGFDIVLGNPPFVAMGRFKDLKSYLATRYSVVSDRTDLSAYFFERGLKVLKPGGRLGYISTSTFFQSGSGRPLRDYLRQNAALECIVDFGDHQIFDGVATLPIILTMQSAKPDSSHYLRYWEVDEMPRGNFGDAFADAAFPFPQSALGSGSWKLEPADGLALRTKIRAGKPTLKEVYGSPLYGIKTGLNAAFIVDDEVKVRLCQEDSRSEKLLKPFLTGKDLTRWLAEPKNIWIIYTPHDSIEIDDFPAIRAFLAPFRSKLEARATDQAWYELQQPQEVTKKAFDGAKIMYPEFSRGPEFVASEECFYGNNKIFFFDFVDDYLLSLLNSKCLWFILSSLAPQVIGGSRELRKQYVELLPIPPSSDTQKALLGALARNARMAAKKRYDLQQTVTRRIPDLHGDPAAAKLSSALKQWWTLPNFTAFQKEVEKVLKTKIPLKERNEWESWISAIGAEIRALTTEIEELERSINVGVYDLFALTPREIALLEESVEI